MESPNTHPDHLVTLLNDLEDLGPYQTSLKIMAAGCDRIAREAEDSMSRITKEADPLLFQEFGNLLRDARELSLAAKKAAGKADRAPDNLMVLRYGNLLGQLGLIPS